MKEEWLFPNAIVPVDVETTAALVSEVMRLIKVVGGMALAQPEREPLTEAQALDFLKRAWHSDREEQLYKSIWKEATPPQPEQEPVAWYHNDFGSVELSRIPRAGWKPLYTTPPLPVQPEERNFCPRCGKRTADPTTIHTCTPPQ